MNKIVLRSSTMWLFDVIKNVMSLTVPKKKKNHTHTKKQNLEKPTKPRLLTVPYGATRPGSGPSPSQSQLGSMRLFAVPLCQRKVDWAEIFPHLLQDLTKAINSEFQALKLCVRSGGE